jgi:hypothetical protein
VLIVKVVKVYRGIRDRTTLILKLDVISYRLLPLYPWERTLCIQWVVPKLVGMFW